MNKKNMLVRRMAINAVMAAIYICLSFYSPIVAGVKITFEGFPVVVSAIIFGPIDAIIVGFLGEFINQMLTYGFTPTTLLWILPSVSQGLFIGVCMYFAKKGLNFRQLFQNKGIFLIFAACAISGVIAACFNTLAYYVDSNMFGYYNYHMVLGVFWIRVLLGAGIGSVMGIISVPITLALKRAKLIG